MINSFIPIAFVRCIVLIVDVCLCKIDFNVLH